MRLIEAASLKYVEPPTFTTTFSSDTSEPYAILSHRWGPEELRYQDLTDPRVFWGSPPVFNKRGFHKLYNFAQVALSYNIKWIWCDTCCIDKRDATEYSEAINSMFQWYRDSKLCFAYLADWRGINGGVGDGVEFTESVWFQRCWTLQELIAPSKVIFYDGQWTLRGTKLDFAEEISRRTRIEPAVLMGTRTLDRVSIAQRMSWAADREAAKMEDVAYCLLGIFDVSMPMLYGEGKRAFVRLQEEIIKRNADQSIFVWTSSNVSNNLLASSPADFARCNEVHEMHLHKKAFALNNLGLEIELELRQIRGNTYVGYLACENRSPDNPVSLMLECEPGTTYLRRIQSCLSHQVEQHSRQLRKSRKVTILRQVPDTYLDIPVPLYGFQLGGSCKSFVLVNNFDSKKYWDIGRWQRDNRPTPSMYPVFKIPTGESTSLATLVLFIGKTRLLLHLMYDFDFHPCCHISKDGRSLGQVFSIRSSGDADSESKMAWLDEDTGWTKNDKSMELDKLVHPYTGERAWAVKSLHRGGFTATIPREFTKPYRDVDVSFSPHPITSDWVFDLRYDESMSSDDSPFWNLGFPIVSGSHDLEHILMQYNLPWME